MDFNDGSQYCIVVDPIKHKRERQLFEFRVASARSGKLYVDTAFKHHRYSMADMPALLMYQFVYGQWSPEEQANFFCNTIGELRPNEMVMLDIEVESHISNPADFARRWLQVVETTLQTLAWVYVPGPLSDQLTREVTGDRIVKAPRYSGGTHKGKPPNWPHDVHQYSDKGYFPGCPNERGDVNYTELTIAEVLSKCGKTKTKGVEMAVDNYPIKGSGGMVLLCPTGGMSADKRQAWLSASLFDGTGSIRVYAQGDSIGIHDWTWGTDILTPKKDNLLARPVVELWDGVTKLVITWELQSLQGGVICLETKPRS